MKPKWHSNLVLICEKCGKKLVEGATDALPNPSTQLKDWMKKKLVASSEWGTTRVVMSSCLDVCPDGLIAVGFTSDRKDLETTVECIDPFTEADRVLHITRQRAKPV